MKTLFLSLSLWMVVMTLHSQTNIHFTNPAILEILKGQYDPQPFMPPFPVDDPATIAHFLQHNVAPDSLLSTLLGLQPFHNRNTGSDTVSDTRGMGAARRWVLNKFNQLSGENHNRLITGYLEFDQDICGMGRHRNVVAVLPGQDTSDASFIIIEAHLDSRCADVCDIECLAEGMEDNGSGVALVIELARLMRRFVFDHTIVFMAVTGEEQNLAGSTAFAQYAVSEGLKIKAVFNNDVVGGIICGETSSAPSCPGLNHIDSTQVRLFSHGGFNSAHKSLSRFIKLEYQEMILPLAAIPMQITLMSAEDRTGRGSDHIPFRENGYTAMRFCSANEHGNADVSDPDYHDRQHTSGDILGVDTNNDDVIDSFYVNFNYLSRNTVINGNSAAMAALGPDSPTLSLVSQDGEKLYIEVEDPHDYNHYVIGVRVSAHDFDTLYYIQGGKSGTFILRDRNLNIFVTAASIDSLGIESLFSDEELVRITGTVDLGQEANVELFQNKPNPFDESTIISFWVQDPVRIQSARLVIADMKGVAIKEINVPVKAGMNEVVYTHGYNVTGAYLYTLVINGQPIETKRMVFAN